MSGLFICGPVGRVLACLFNRRLLGVLGLFGAVLPQTLLAENRQVLPSVVRIEAVHFQEGKKFVRYGSGFAVEGGIVTAHHVVENDAELSIYIGDGDQATGLEGKVKFFDPHLDIAFIELDYGYKLPAVELNTSFPVQAGSEIYAIGNPLGFTSSISKGIVSSSGTNKGQPYLHSDALIKPGNSGGAMVDRTGRVIAMVLGSVKNDNDERQFAYTLPAIQIQTFLSQKGQGKDGFLGVKGQSVPIANQMGEGKALKITKVVKPCGLAVGDVIASFNGLLIEDQRDLVLAVRELPPGTIAKAFIERDGQCMDIDLRIFKRDQ